MSGRALVRSLTGAAFAALVFGVCVFGACAADDGILGDVVLEDAFSAGALDAPAGLGAADLAGRARRPVLIFRTRFIMAPVT